MKITIEEIKKDLERFLIKFDQAIDNKNQKNAILKGINGISNSKLDDNLNTSIEDAFKLYSEKMRINDILQEIIDTMPKTLLDYDLIMSETHIKNLDTIMHTLVKKIQSYINLVPDKFEYTVNDISSCTEIISLYNKYPNTELLFLEYIRGNINPEINIQLEKIKLKLKFQIPPEYAKYESNNIHELLYYPTSGMGKSFSDILKPYGISNAKYSSISTLGRSHGIIIIKYASTVKYSTYLLESFILGKSGLTSDIVKNTNTIERIDSDKISIAYGITLYADKTYDILTMRKTMLLDVSNSIIDLVSKVKYIFETNNDVDFYEIKLSPERILHLLCGPNPLISVMNYNSETAILQHWKGALPEKITTHITPTHTHIAHIRQNIKTEIMSSMKSINASGMNSILGIEKMQTIFNNEMFNAFNTYIEKSNTLDNIVKQESLISYLSDVNIRGKRFIREFNNLYNKYNGEDRSKIDTRNDIEKIIEQSLEMSISEKNNIFNTIDEKRYLFSI